MTEVALSADQLEHILTAIVTCGMSICACLGFNAHRSSD